MAERKWRKLSACTVEPQLDALPAGLFARPPSSWSMTGGGPQIEEERVEIKGSQGLSHLARGSFL
jgi:hypothetical protein